MHCEIDPHQHLARIETSGLGHLHPGDGHHAALRADGRTVRRTGKGEGRFHPAHPLLPVRQIENGGAHCAGDLHPALLGLLALQEDFPLGIADPKDIRTGVRYDHLQGLFVENGGIQYGFIAAQLGPVKFQLHSVPLLVRALRPFFMLQNYMYKVGQLCLSFSQRSPKRVFKMPRSALGDLTTTIFIA